MKSLPRSTPSRLHGARQSGRAAAVHAGDHQQARRTLGRRGHGLVRGRVAHRRQDIGGGACATNRRRGSPRDCPGAGARALSSAWRSPRSSRGDPCSRSRRCCSSSAPASRSASGTSARSACGGTRSCTCGRRRAAASPTSCARSSRASRRAPATPARCRSTTSCCTPSCARCRSPQPSASRSTSASRRSSTAASSLPLLYAFACRFLDRQVALLATLLLATSIPHVLYAAEARFYSLFVLMTLANLYAFASLIERRDRIASVGGLRRRQRGLFFLCGLFSMLVLAVQYAILGVLVLAPLAADAAPRPAPGCASGVAAREIAAFLASSAVLAGCVAAYFAGTFARPQVRPQPGAHPAPPCSSPGTPTSPSRRATGCCSPACCCCRCRCVWAWRRGATVLPRRAVARADAARDPRHRRAGALEALLLPPAARALPAAGGRDPDRAHAARDRARARSAALAAPGRAAARDAGSSPLACLLVVATQLPTLASYVSHPERFFARSKKTYDLRRVTQVVRDAVAGSSAARQVSAGRAAQHHGERDAGAVPALVRPRATASCCAARPTRRGRCSGASSTARAAASGSAARWSTARCQLTAPFGLPPDFQRLLGLLEPIGAGPGRCATSASSRTAPCRLRGRQGATSCGRCAACSSPNSAARRRDGPARVASLVLDRAAVRGAGRDRDRLAGERLGEGLVDVVARSRRCRPRRSRACRRCRPRRQRALRIDHEHVRRGLGAVRLADRAVGVEQHRRRRRAFSLVSAFASRAGSCPACRAPRS